MNPPKDQSEEICPSCKQRMDLVCDPTGEKEYYHCFRCDNPIPETPTPRTEQLFKLWSEIPKRLKEGCELIERETATLSARIAELEALNKSLAKEPALLSEFEAMINKAWAERDNYKAAVQDIRIALKNSLADAKAFREDKERLDWLEANPNTLRNCTWVNSNIGRCFTFGAPADATVGQCAVSVRSFREAIDAARALTEGRES